MVKQICTSAEGVISLLLYLKGDCMLQNLTSLEETAERFRKSSEFIWNLSLQFNNLLRPELGNNGLIAYSDHQRRVIGRIIKLREQGMADNEIEQSFDKQNESAQPVSEEKPQCTSSNSCQKNFKILSAQVKFMWKHLCQLQCELDALKQIQGQNNGVANIERIFPLS